MNKLLWLALAASIVSGCALLSEKPVKQDEVLILSFFRDNGQAGIFLAGSEDGLTFTPLNDDKPVMKPGAWPGQNLTRDPSMIYHNGKFRAVWTTSWNGRWFGYAESPDLKQWPSQVKVLPFPEVLPPKDQPGNVWAPEICWDPVQRNYLIIWSSTTSPAGHRLYASRTADGKAFSEAALFFDQKFICIDGMLAFQDHGSRNPSKGQWIMALKNEQEIRDGGKNLRITTAPADFSKPWEPVSKPVAGPGSAVRGNEMAEGPSLLKWKDQWFLYWDAFANGHYCLATSPDLINWTDRSADLKMPPHPRHGTVFAAPRSAVAWLRDAQLTSIALAAGETAGGKAAAPEQPVQTGTGHPFVCTDYSQGKVFIVSAAGKTEWEYKSGTCNDLWVLPNGNLLFNTGNGVREITRDKKVVFDYQSKSEIYACQRLTNGNTFVGECNAGRFLEVATNGVVVKALNILPAGKDGGHSYIRNARLLANGNILACHYGEHLVKEYDPQGKVIRTIKAPGGPHSAIRLPDGNTLIACGDQPGGSRVIEVDAKDQIVWQVTSDDLPGISLKLMTGLQRLPNGNTVMSNWLGHGQFGKAPHLIEVTRDKKVVWTFSDHKTMKTISSIQLLDVPGDVTKGEILH